MASARSMPAVAPAEVHTGPSTMKMRSSSIFSFGKRACNSRAWYQCVVARRPSSRPASARTNAPVQVAATRQRLLQKFDQAQRRRFDHGAAADNQRIEIRIVERLRRDAHADRG